MENTIIYLIGRAGTGKYTIAKEICAMADFRLVDNHLINNPILSLIELDRTLPRRVWENTGKIWDAVIDTMLHISPAEYSFILTNELFENDEADKAWFNEIHDFTKERNSCFIPVRLSISERALLERRATPERRLRFKDTCPDRARRNMREKQLLNIDHRNVIDLDVSDLSAKEAASRILSHARAVKKQVL